MKKKLLLASLLVCATTAIYADDSVQWHGYYRSGLGMDKDLANVNKDGNEVKSLGRFGLEYDNFLASSLSKRWSDNKGQWAQYNFSFNVFDYTDTNTNPTNKNTGDSSVNTLNASDSYAEMGGLSFLPKDSSIWVGKRRSANGIDLLDLDYRKINAHGFGYSSKTFDVALYKELAAGDMGEFGDIVTIDGSLKLKDVKVEGTITKLTKDFSIPYVDSGEKGDTSLSVLAEFKHNKFMGVLPGNTTYRAQLGKGVTAEKLNMAVITDEKDSSTRFTVDGSTMTKAWTLNTVVNLESSKDDSKDLTYSTLSIAARGTNKLRNNLSMVYEASIANKTNVGFDGVDKDSDGTAYKIAVGPTIQLDTMPWVRPILRFSAAIIGGDKEVTGLDKTSELRLGAQFETYF